MSANSSNKLMTKIFAQNLYQYDQIDSTNKQAERLLQTNSLPEGTVIIANTQSNGRGTGNNKWESASDQGLYFSIIIHSPFRHQPITFIFGIALSQMLKKYGIKADLKWPNDVLINKKKICGILCQTKSMPDKKLVCIAGVGINVGQTNFSDIIKHRATSLKLTTGNDYNKEQVFIDYMIELENLYYSNSNIIELWNCFSNMPGKKITVVKNGSRLRVKVLGIDNNGFLQVKSQDGTIESWNSSTNLDIDPEY